MKLENLEFKLVSATDWPELQVLYRHLQPEDPILEDGSDHRTFLDILRSDHFFLLGAYEAAKLLACTYINIVPNISRGASPYAVIENVVTHNEYQNHGIGKALMRETLLFIWDKGCYKAMLMTGSKQVSTHAFYRNSGFDGDAKFAYVAYPK